MEKKSTKIAYFVALGVFIVLLVILGIQFKGKENPVFVGDGAFYTTGDGVFLDGIQRTVDDSEGSKYALDGSYYVSPEAGTYFELCTALFSIYWVGFNIYSLYPLFSRFMACPVGWLPFSTARLVH